MRLIKSILNFFKAEKTTYSHRNRTIEVVASEQGLDLDSLKEETKAILKREGRVEAIEMIEKRFHVPLNAAWRFVDKLDSE